MPRRPSSLPRRRPSPTGRSPVWREGAAVNALSRRTPRDLPRPAPTDARPVARNAPAGAKAPIQEVLHCPLAFAGVHLLKGLPERFAVAYHFCKDVDGDMNQCVLYDGTGPTPS